MCGYLYHAAHPAILDGLRRAARFDELESRVDLPGGQLLPAVV